MATEPKLQLCRPLQLDRITFSRSTKAMCTCPRHLFLSLGAEQQEQLCLRSWRPIPMGISHLAGSKLPTERFWSLRSHLVGRLNEGLWLIEIPRDVEP